MIVFLIHLARADSYPIRLHGGLGGLSAAVESGATETGMELGGGVLGRVTVQTPRPQLALDVHAREYWANGDPRLVGALFFGLRMQPDWPVHLRLGLAHNHEIPMPLLQEQPVLSVLGSAEGIRHRTGLELGIGREVSWPYSIPERWDLHDRLGMGINVGGAWFADPQGPALYGYVDVTVSVGVGARRMP